MSAAIWPTAALSIPEMVKLYEALPLKEAVVEKWLYGNAKRVLRLD